ncbi:phosphatidylinositol transfer protein PDR16 and related proteins [Moesziomyces antarcticus T-34]|uniref:Phosphatidylinositol transfer protein PDR16 and related proteins n=1 Tax=Pseudozyma antarctica (strain T-34) TaxID=1151754 RepID=M9LQM6_PSEA3|nr:phosphatidylinositol transfer protein PDR16 and related proteins [Moesziomyces antarcticus T-34]
MSSQHADLTKTQSRASSTGTRSSIFGRASGFMMGHRRPQAASESQAGASSSQLDLAATPSSSDAKAGGVRKFEHIFPAPDPSVKLAPPAPLSDSQQAKYDEMLQHFKSIDEFPTSLKGTSPKKPLTEWEKMRNLSRESMIRYLRATKWDVASAKKRLTETIAWRREYGVDGLKAEDLEPEAMTGKETILGYDNKGRPLHYMHPSRNTTDETPRQMQYAVWILERAIDLMPPGVEMLALLINFGGKKRNPTSISNAKLMLYILQNHYVERLGIALCINVPWIFKAFWNAIYPFIDPVTKGKCKFDEAIKDEVPNAQLATDFGGLLDFPYDHESYWPQLVKLTEQRRAEQLERFRTLCDSQVGASEWVIRGGDERRSTAPAKQDSGYHEAVSPVAARAESSNGSTVVEKASPVYEAEGDDESQLDRFYTSQQELPPQLESNEWENQTAVSHDAKPHAKEHGDASFFAAVVGGVSAGLVGGKAAEVAAHQTSGRAHTEAQLHDKHNHTHHAAPQSQEPQPAPVSV